MRVVEYLFNDLYHKYFVIQADDLTAECRYIKTKEDDCYILASMWTDHQGTEWFNVLSLGNAWDNCTRGLGRKNMLGQFGLGDVFDMEAKIITPDEKMIRKNEPYQKKAEEDVSEQLKVLRADNRLDHLRSPGYPDILQADFLEGNTLVPADICATGIDGPFLYGVMAEEAGGHGVYEKVKCLPYLYQGEFRLLALSAGEEDEKTKKELARLKELYARMGLSFSSVQMWS